MSRITLLRVPTVKLWRCTHATGTGHRWESQSLGLVSLQMLRSRKSVLSCKVGTTLKHQI